GAQPLVAPGVALGQFLRAQVLGPEHDVRRVIARPVVMQQPALGLHPSKERRAGVRREDVERGALQAVRFDPGDPPRADVAPIRRTVGARASVRSWSKPSTKLPLTWMPWSWRMATRRA